MSHFLKERYQQELIPDLMKSLSLDNIMQVPRVEKVVVNIGVGEALDNAKALDGAVEDLRIITGQQPIVTRAKQSIAGFKLRRQPGSAHPIATADVAGRQRIYRPRHGGCDQ